MKRAFQPTASSLAIPGATTALLLLAARQPLLRRSERWRVAVGLDGVLQNFLIASMAPVIIVLAFASAGILYALGGHDEQARRLLGSGIGGCIALVVVHLLNYVLPDSIPGQLKLRS